MSIENINYALLVTSLGLAEEDKVEDVEEIKEIEDEEDTEEDDDEDEDEEDDELPVESSDWES